jgi:hypothetical protein
MVAIAPVAPAVGSLRLVAAAGLPILMVMWVFHAWIVMAMPAAGCALARSSIVAMPSESPILPAVVHVH